MEPGGTARRRLCSGTRRQGHSRLGRPGRPSRGCAAYEANIPAQPAQRAPGRLHLPALGQLLDGPPHHVLLPPLELQQGAQPRRIAAVVLHVRRRLRLRARCRCTNVPPSLLRMRSGSRDRGCAAAARTVRVAVIRRQQGSRGGWAGTQQHSRGGATSLRTCAARRLSDELAQQCEPVIALLQLLPSASTGGAGELAALPTGS